MQTPLPTPPATPPFRLTPSPRQSPTPPPSVWSPPPYKPSGKYAATEGLSIRPNKRAGPAIDIGEGRKLKKGRLFDHDITYVSKIWYPAERTHLQREIRFYQDPARLGSLQGDVVPHLIAVSALPGKKVKLEYEAPHHSGWRIADVTATLEEKEKIREAYDAIHRVGIVHNSVRWGNILITDDDEVRLIDFSQALALPFLGEGMYDQGETTNEENELEDLLRGHSNEPHIFRGSHVVVPMKYRSPMFPSNLRRQKLHLPNGRAVFRRGNPSDPAVNPPNPVGSPNQDVGRPRGPLRRTRKLGHPYARARSELSIADTEDSFVDERPEEMRTVGKMELRRYYWEHPEAIEDDFAALGRDLADTDEEELAERSRRSLGPSPSPHNAMGGVLLEPSGPPEAGPSRL